MYSETAAYGHMGRNSVKKTVAFNVNGAKKNIEVETFTWEKLDCIDEVKLAFNLCRKTVFLFIYIFKLSIIFSNRIKI